MTDVKYICEKVGRQTLMKRVDVGTAAVTNAISAGKFPAVWYKAIKYECDNLGLDCPMSLFSFKECHFVNEVSQ
jgi:hypothetical protein